MESNFLELTIEALDLINFEGDIVEVSSIWRWNYK